MSANADRLQGPRHWFEPAVKDAGIPNLHWRDLRHTFASRLMMAGVNPRTFQELMGHKLIQKTMRYAPLAATYPLAAVERLADVAKAVESQAPTGTRTGTGILGEQIAEPAYVQ